MIATIKPHAKTVSVSVMTTTLDPNVKQRLVSYFHVSFSAATAATHKIINISTFLSCLHLSRRAIVILEIIIDYKMKFSWKTFYGSRKHPQLSVVKYIFNKT